MSIQKKSLISTLKTTKKANVASSASPNQLPSRANVTTKRAPPAVITKRTPATSPPSAHRVCATPSAHRVLPCGSPSSSRL